MRILTVKPAEAGQCVLDWLRAKLSMDDGAARRLLRSRKVRVAGTPCSNPMLKLRAGQRVELPGESKPTGPQPVLRFVDAHLVIVDKPSGLTTMRHADEAAEFGSRGKKFLPGTLEDLLPRLIADREGGPPMPVHAVHRIDKETSGLVVFARTLEAERHLGIQFRAHTVERVYRALVRGVAADARIESNIVRDRGDGRRGSGEGEGQHAVTHVSLIERLGEFSLVECRLETGRTHQVRIHLGEAGTPLCGERIYDRPLHGRPFPDGSGMERVALHAAQLGLEHPATGKRMSWASALPADMAGVLARMRHSGGNTSSSATSH